MDLRTTDALKAAANAWPGGRELIVFAGDHFYKNAKVTIGEGGTVVIRLLDPREMELERQLADMNLDPLTGSTEHEVHESLPELVMPNEPQPVSVAEPVTPTIEETADSPAPAAAD